MAAVRTNVVKDPVARAAYIDGVKGLKAEPVTKAPPRRRSLFQKLFALHS